MPQDSQAEVFGLQSVPECFDAVNGNYRDVVLVPLHQHRLFLYIHFLQNIIIGTLGGFDDSLGHFAEVTPRT